MNTAVASVVHGICFTTGAYVVIALVEFVLRYNPFS